MAQKLNSVTAKQKNFVTGFPIYYGWVIMLVGTLGMIMTSPGQTYAESIFIESIIKDLSISRSLVSSLYAFGTLVGGLSLPYWGKQIDKQGTRKMVTLVAILFGLSCIYMGFVKNALMIGIGFILIRMLGQGSLGLISQTAINHWWVKKRGTIMGISGLLMALLGMGAFPSLVYWLISISDWRMAYIILGLGLLLIMAPVGYLLFRDKPEDYQLYPDGMVMEDSDVSQTATVDQFGEENWTLKEAMHTQAFWVFAIGLSLFALLATGLTFHLVSIFQTQGLDPTLAASVFVPIAITAALITLLTGMLSDRIALHYLMALGLVLQGITLVISQSLQGAGTVLLFGIIFGITSGVVRPVGTVVWPSFFGRKHLGSIFGFISALTVLGAALGPLPFGFAYDLIGHYRPVLLVFAAISIILGLLTLLTRKPSKKVTFSENG
jgi:MFS transporter, OFA family, oxalate/formate antiporter